MNVTCQKNSHLFWMLVATVALLFPFEVFAQDDPVEGGDGVSDIEDFSLENLLNLETEVASKGKNQTVREAPGIVTIITREEIQRSGSRDLLELLRLVPGFQFGTDSFNTVFAGFRGLWASDGKLLVLLDGHELTDSAYYSVVLGNRVPLDWVSRIEIIRGPGSVMYGGSAAYAVINIITRSAKELGGISVSGSYSQMLDGLINHDQSVSDTIGLAYLSASYGQVYQKAGGLNLVINAFGGTGMRSDQPYTDVWGDSYNMAGHSETNPLMLNLKAEYKNFTVRYLFEHYRINSKDAWGENIEDTLPAYFQTSSLGLSYDWEVSDSVTITPQVKHTFQRPWSIYSEAAKNYDETYWETKIHQIETELALNWTITDWLSILVGTEYRFETANDETYGYEPNLCGEIDETLGYDPDGCKTDVSYHNGAVYAQEVLSTKYLDISAGARLERHSQFGNSFVPRAAITKAYGPFHFKILGSQSFRSPSVENMANSPDIRPEKTTVFEGEVGYQLTSFLFIVVNGFYTMVDSPIVYFYNYDEGTEEITEGYQNQTKTGTTGVESELKFKYKHHFANLNYSFYHPAGLNEVEVFKVPAHSNVLLGFAAHKLALNSGVELVENLTLNLSASLLFGDRFGYIAVDEDEESVLDKFDPEFILNANIMYRNLGIKGLWLMLGARNITNSNISYIQPYDNWHAPLPGASAEVFLKAGYDFKFN